ncbi:MAG: uracil-DNA glycosylase family protein, partial [Longimicrobiales bacterium]
PKRIEEQRFRAIFRRVHAAHSACLGDEWLTQPCKLADGRLATRPLVWSRRNGPWHRVPVLWVGAAPGNAGGRGSGVLGAHGTRIPFGGDIAGANLDAMLGSIGLDRNRTFLTAALNHLPARGGGEPTLDEILAPVGEYSSSLVLLRDTLLATGPALIVALGNVALRAVCAAARVDESVTRLPSLQRLRSGGFDRGMLRTLTDLCTPQREFADRWTEAWDSADLPDVLWITHPSGQNMSPYAGVGTLFHTRMIEALAALRFAVQSSLNWDVPVVRPAPPGTGIYALPEWRERIGPHHERLDALWRANGI